MRHVAALSLLGTLLAGCTAPTSSNWSGHPDPSPRYAETPNVVTLYPGWEAPPQASAPQVVQYTPGAYEFTRDMMMLDAMNSMAMELNGIRMGY